MIIQKSVKSNSGNSGNSGNSRNSETSADNNMIKDKSESVLPTFGAGSAASQDIKNMDQEDGTPKVEMFYDDEDDQF